MTTLLVDASNSCIPLTSPLVLSSPPLPSTTRGEPTVLDGRPGRINNDRSILLYASGKLVIVRDFSKDGGSSSFVYRGHMANVTCAKFSPSGSYIASADVRGKLRVWSWDNEEHLCKLDLTVLSGPIRCIAWDFESKRICVAGERMDSSSDCVRVIQWDTGVTCGELTQHTRGRASSCDIKPNRPMRLVSGGMDDSKVYCHSGPPFKRIVDGVPEEAVHVKGAVNGLQFSSNGLLLVSVGADRTVAIYDGKTMELKSKLENVHQGTIYGCVWNSNDTHILTCSADGTTKLLSAEPLEVVYTWDVVELLSGESKASTPIGAMVTGCAFIKDDIPVVVTINGEIGLLPKPPMFPNGLVDYEKYTGHVAPITGMAIDISRGFLYTGDSDGVLCQFSLATNEPVKRFSNPESTDLLGKMHGDAIISCLTVTCLGEVMTAGWDDTVRKIDVTGNTVNPPISLDAQPNAIATGTELTVILTVKGILMIRCDGAVSSLQSLDYVALSVCVSLDDSTIYVGGEDCKIHVYNVSSAFKLEEIQSIVGAHLKPIYALSLSHDQTKLASSDVRDICIRDTTSSEFKCIIGKSRWCFHTQRITCLAWSMDDNVLASGGADDSLYLWSLRRPSKRLHYPFSHRGGVTGLSFFPLDSNEPFMGCGRLVSVGSDACVNQWDVQKDIESKFS